jgi:hypothetical protein
VSVENGLRGTRDWQGAQSSSIEGYTSNVSSAPGGSVEIHVNMPAGGDYRVEVYRLGWYAGAGGRRVACLPSCTSSKPGFAQPTPAPDPSTGSLDAGWPETDVLTVPADWVSGYYVALLRITSGTGTGGVARVPFIVRAPPSRASAILVQVPVTTWEAYNNWGGKSLYAFNSSGPDTIGGSPAAIKVSFDRPYTRDPEFSFDFDLMRFLEREGYDVSYTTGVDTEADPSELMRHRLVISAGHDEYWTRRIRDGFEAARDGAVNLAFMGADIGEWQARLDDAGRTLVEYRSSRLDPESDAASKTVRFRDLSAPRPECLLEGVEHSNGVGSGGDYSVTPEAADHTWLTGTGLTQSSTLSGLVGYEWDSIRPGCLDTASTVLFHYGGGPAAADAVTFATAAGGRIFGAGSNQFATGLDDYSQPSRADLRLERFASRMLDDLSGLPEGSTSPSTVGPQVRITGGPDPVVTSSDAAFKFTVDESGAVLECQLDDREWTLCSPPARYDGLSPGPHRFQVRATGTDGNSTATPASWSWNMIGASPPPPPETGGPAPAGPEPWPGTSPGPPQVPDQTPEHPHPAACTALRRGPRVTVRCPERRGGGIRAARLRWRLVRGKRTYARGRGVIRAARWTLDLRTAGALPPGRYRLLVSIADPSRDHASCVIRLG